MRIDQLKRNLHLKTGSTAYPSTKEALCHYLEGQQTNLKGRRRIFTQCKGMNFDTSDSCVNTLIVANFNLLSRAIQGDTQRFELILERFIKVRDLL